MFEFEDIPDKARDDLFNKTAGSKLLVKHIQIRKESA